MIVKTNSKHPPMIEIALDTLAIVTDIRVGVLITFYLENSRQSSVFNYFLL